MRKAFTLIELLVVVSIIALLIALLLPALSKTKYAANVTKCGISVRGIGAIQLSYAIDNKNYFPEAGYRYDGNGSWTDAAHNYGARVRAWELVGTVGDGLGTPKRPYDLRPVYYDYMQNNNMDIAMHCPFLSETMRRDDRFGINEDKILTYMLYVGNNYRWKHFYMESVGAYERLGDTWSPEGDHEADFTLLASDVAWGNFAPHGEKDENGNPYQGALSSHPAPNGAIYEHAGQRNDGGGYVIADDQTAPVNFADADGSVQTFKINDESINDTDNWVVNRHSRGKDALLPRDLAR